MKRTIKWLPIIVIEMYLLLTVFLYKFGPWDFKTVNPVQMYTLLAMYQLALFFGYFVAMKCVFAHNPLSYRNRTSVIKIVKILAVINLFFGCILLARGLGLKTFSFIEIYERLIAGIKNPAEVYNMKFGMQVEDIFLGKFGTILIALWSPVSYSVIPLNCLLFKKLTYGWKAVALINIALSITLYVAMGTNKGIFDIAIFIVVACFINIFQKINFSQKKINFLKIVCLFLVILIPALVFFNKAIGGRGMGSGWQEAGYALGGQVYLDRSSFIFKYIPEGLIVFVVLLSGYLCQGYYGFSMITAVDWTPMFGLGNSMFLVDQLNLKELTYQSKVQIQFGWDADVQWHSIYSWLSNDFGYFGVVVVMFVIGFFFAIVYKESILFDNPLSQLLLCFLFILFFYIPANNQVLQGLESFSSFWFAFFAWFLCKNYRFILRLKG